MAEEFFMNKNAKKLVDLGTALNDSKENIVHLVNIFFNLLNIMWSLASDVGQTLLLEIINFLGEIDSFIV